MKEIVRINNNDIQVKMWNGQKVVTLTDIDSVHERVEGTAKRNFIENKNHLIINEDYFFLKPADVQKYEKRTLGFDVPNRGLTLFTESGYLLLVKSFTDDLAWEVQRDLVNSYFKLKELAPQSSEVSILQDKLSTVFVQINNMENILESQSELLNSVMDSMTISTRQQEKILKTARNRVNALLGGAHSEDYRIMGRTYLANLWNNFKSDLHCGSSYKDLNPADFSKAIDWINQWEYIEA